MKRTDQSSAELIRRNWSSLIESVSAEAALHNRDASQIKIIGVTKYVTAELARQLVEAGCSALGESRPQSLWEKCTSLHDRPDIQWHMIGHLQRNKLSKTLPLISCLHSLDSARLASSIDDQIASNQDRNPLPCLAEINVTNDPAKTGLKSTELAEFLERLANLKHIAICGLMAMSSHNASIDQARREFAHVRELLFRMQTDFCGTHNLTELSMGMSGDYRPAIAEGATMLRIGSAIWDGVTVGE